MKDADYKCPYCRPAARPRMQKPRERRRLEARVWPRTQPERDAVAEIALKTGTC